MHHPIQKAPAGKREETYPLLYGQLEQLLAGEHDLTACLANVAAAVKETFGFWWVGFYLVKEGELVLGPFQGPVACTRIPFSKGVCGACYSGKKSVVVPDVDAFPGHIACSAASKSEIVVPVFHRNGEVAMVFDIDSDKPADFDETDRIALEAVAALISDKL